MYSNIFARIKFPIQGVSSLKDVFDLVIFDGVYPPSEDTYLLIDSLTMKPSDTVLDVGCGAGAATLKASTIAKQVLSVDISLKAVQNTKENLIRNNLGVNVSVIQADLFSALSERHKFSLILFNPPYLPSDGTQTQMDHALIGGDSGIELTEKFIVESTKHITKGGSINIVVSSLADIGKIRTTLIENNFKVSVERELSMFFESIQLLRGVWQGHKETVL